MSRILILAAIVLCVLSIAEAMDKIKTLGRERPHESNGQSKKLKENPQQDESASSCDESKEKESEITEITPISFLKNGTERHNLLCTFFKNGRCFAVLEPIIIQSPTRIGHRIMRIYDEDGKLIHTILANRAAMSSYSACGTDDKDYFVGVIDNITYTWNSADMLFKPTREHYAPRMVCSMSHANKVYFALLFVEKILVLDEQGECIRALNELVSKIFFKCMHLCVHEGQCILVCGTNEGKVIIWDMESSACVSSFIADNGPIERIHVFSGPQNKLIIITSLQDAFKLWDITGTLLHAFEGIRIHSFAILRNGSDQFMVTSDGYLNFQLWHISTGINEMSRMRIPETQGILGSVHAFSKASKSLLVSGLGKIHVWDVLRVAQ